MKANQLFKFLGVMALTFLNVLPAGYSEPLVYRGSGQDGSVPSAAPGESSLVPVGYSTNYDNQYYYDRSY